MKYDVLDENRLIIDLEGMDPIKALKLIGVQAYKTATPRVHEHVQVSDDIPDMTAYISHPAGRPMLLMNYINDRDCRTKVYQTDDGKLIFDAYAFQQRKVTSDEFMDGAIVDHADKFLDDVIAQLS